MPTTTSPPNSGVVPRRSRVIGASSGSENNTESGFEIDPNGRVGMLSYNRGVVVGCRRPTERVRCGAPVVSATLVCPCRTSVVFPSRRCRRPRDVFDETTRRRSPEKVLVCH